VCAVSISWRDIKADKSAILVVVLILLSLHIIVAYKTQAKDPLASRSATRTATSITILILIDPFSATQATAKTGKLPRLIDQLKTVSPTS
jgi:hypothetical protein